jgi:glutaredoxin-like protein
MLVGMRWLWVVILLAAAVVVIDALRTGDLMGALGFAALGLALVWWLSPWQGGRSARHEEVLGRPAEERAVVIYWRPGCVFCARLRGRLGRTGRRATWVNIWQDEAAAAYVRSVNDGDETVPTVVIDGEPHTNPEPQLVLDRLLAA